MAVVCEGTDEQVTVKVTGDIDHHSAKRILSEVVEQIEAYLPKKLVMDFGGVSFMDSSGIAILIRTRKAVAELGGAVSVIKVPEQAMRVLRAAGIDRLMRFE